MSTTFASETMLTTFECGSCGGVYAIGEVYRDKCQDDGSSWNCPYCRRGWGYSKNSRIEQLRRELKSVEESRARESRWHDQTRVRLKDAKRSRDAHKGQVTRLRNRAVAGVCPCCNRTFRQLAAHMKTKHPTWNKSKAPA